MKTEAEIKNKIEQLSLLAKESCDELIKHANIHSSLFPDENYSHGHNACINAFKVDIYLELVNILKWAIEDDDLRNNLIKKNRRKINYNLPVAYHTDKKVIRKYFKDKK